MRDITMFLCILIKYVFLSRKEAGGKMKLELIL